METSMYGKKLHGRFWAVLTVLIGIFMVYSPPVSAAEINLRYSSALNPHEPPNLVANHILDEVEKRTNGKVKVKRFMGGSMGSMFEQLPLVTSGAVDIIALQFDLFPAQLPLHEIMNSDQMVDGEQGFKNLMALTHEIEETRTLLEAEQKRNNIKVLYWNAQGVTGITTNFPAKSLADLQGKKVSALTKFHRKAFSEEGWIPVNVQIPEMYEALSRGVIDAIHMATAAVLPLKWNEVGKTHLVLSDNMIFSQALTFNLDVWNKLPADVQQIFDEVALETAKFSIHMDQDIKNKTYDAFKKMGTPLVYLTEEESKVHFEILMRNAMENWLENAEKMGVTKEAEVIQKYWVDMRWGK